MKQTGKKVWYSHQGTVITFIILRALVVLTGVLSSCGETMNRFLFR